MQNEKTALSLNQISMMAQLQYEGRQYLSSYSTNMQRMLHEYDSRLNTYLNNLQKASFLDTDTVNRMLVNMETEQDTYDNILYTFILGNDMYYQEDIHSIQHLQHNYKLTRSQILENIKTQITVPNILMEYMIQLYILHRYYIIHKAIELQIQKHIIMQMQMQMPMPMMYQPFMLILQQQHPIHITPEPFTKFEELIKDAYHDISVTETKPPKNDTDLYKEEMIIMSKFINNQFEKSILNFNEDDNKIDCTKNLFLCNF